MAIAVTWADPTDVSSVGQAYVRVGSITLDDINETGTIGVLVFRSAEARLANKQPIAALQFNVLPTRTPPCPAVTLPDGTVVVPAIPEIPSYREVEEMFNESTAEPNTPRNRMRSVIYTLLKYLPAFSNGIDV